MPNAQPNIVLITTDQERYDASGPRAPGFMRRPHFDLLAREGVTFSSAYADCPLCVPARISLMTGKYALTHGMFNNGRTTDVMGREGTLPTLLRGLGYQTAAIGKMHFGPMRVRHGFDEMILPEDYYRHMRRLGYDAPLPMRNGLGINELYPGMATVPESQTLTAWIAEQCVDYILERRDPSIPFFLWCSFSKPHPPLDPPEPYYSMYRQSPIPAPIRGDWSDSEHCPEAFKRWREENSFDLLTPDILHEARAAYYGLITQIDNNAGRVFGALQELDLLQDTLILWASDHGEYLGDFQCGGKAFFHEPSAHVPFVLRPPRAWSDDVCGTESSALVTHADILPTLVAAAGGVPPSGIDGQNLLGVLRGEAPPRQYLEAAAWLNRDPAPLHLSITDGRWKYSWYPEGSAEQLFDIISDPQELHNLAGLPQWQEQRQAMHRALVERHAQRQSPFVQEGRLIGIPLRGDSRRTRRNRRFPYYVTDHAKVEWRH